MRAVDPEVVIYPREAVQRFIQGALRELQSTLRKGQELVDEVHAVQPGLTHVEIVRQVGRPLGHTWWPMFDDTDLPGPDDVSFEVEYEKVVLPLQSVSFGFAGVVPRHLAPEALGRIEEYGFHAYVSRRDLRPRTPTRKQLMHWWAAHWYATKGRAYNVWAATDRESRLAARRQRKAFRRARRNVHVPSLRRWFRRRCAMGEPDSPVLIQARMDFIGALHERKLYLRLGPRSFAECAAVGLQEAAESKARDEARRKARVEKAVAELLDVVGGGLRDSGASLDVYSSAMLPSPYQVIEGQLWVWPEVLDGLREVTP